MPLPQLVVVVEIFVANRVPNRIFRQYPETTANEAPPVQLAQVGEQRRDLAVGVKPWVLAPSGAWLHQGRGTLRLRSLRLS
jgi:hypothetical protein